MEAVFYTGIIPDANNFAGSAKDWYRFHCIQTQSTSTQHCGWPVLHSVFLFDECPALQVDLSLEAENLLQFNLNFKKHAAVCFPVPIYPLVAPEVLVETFQEGDSISRCCSSLHVSTVCFFGIACQKAS